MQTAVYIAYLSKVFSSSAITFFLKFHRLPQVTVDEFIVIRKQLLMS